MTDIRWMTADDTEAIVAAGVLFDEPSTAEHTAKFLAQPNHHIAIAYVDDVPAGFVSGVEISHPDKPTEMLLYELGVEEEFHRRGIGTALTNALREKADELGCKTMWVLTDDDNEAAIATYKRSGSKDPEEQVVLEWNW